jgi:hypothetical protein
VRIRLQRPEAVEKLPAATASAARNDGRPSFIDERALCRIFRARSGIQTRLGAVKSCVRIGLRLP